MLPTASRYIKCSPNGTHPVDHTTSHHHKTIKSKPTNNVMIPKRLRKDDPTLLLTWMLTSAPVAPGMNACMMIVGAKKKPKRATPQQLCLVLLTVEGSEPPPSPRPPKTSSAPLCPHQLLRFGVSEL